MKTNLLFINIFLLIASVSLGLFIFRSSTKLPFNKPICDRCNVILISLDTLGSNHLPCYGYYRNTAENTCNFAKKNVFFTNSFSNASWTLPSHFSIFTSLYPNHHGIVNYDNNDLDQSIPTVAELFKKAGYKTIYTGLLKDPSLPLDRGLGRGFETLSDPLVSQNLLVWERSINQLINNNRKNQSTFLFLHTYFVHDPYVVNNVSDEKSKRIYAKDNYPDIPLDWKSFWIFSNEFKAHLLDRYTKMIDNDEANKEKNQKIVDGLNEAKDLIEAEKIYTKLVSDLNVRYIDFSSFYLNKAGETSGKVAYTRDLYDEMVYRLDKNLKMIYDLTSNPDLADNTIIIITSDHGEEFKEHDRLVHPMDHLYNTTTSVPLIMYIPGIKQKKIGELVQSIDILPTVLSLTGLTDAKNNFDGIDLTDMILGRWGAKKNNYLISEGSNESIRNDRWKLYINNSGEGIGVNTDELYDLYKDPEEKNNVAQKEPEIVKKLRDNLNRIIYKNETNY